MRGNPVCDEPTFIALVQEHGVGKAAKLLGLSVRAVFARRKGIEERGNHSISVPDSRSSRRHEEYPARWELEVNNGTVLVGSDAHYWPGVNATAHRAFVKLCAEFSPKAVIVNGDMLDFASISRFPPIGWEKQPSLVDEIDETKARLEEIHSASKKAAHIWPLGNHDGRFSTRIATVAPEYAKIHGFALKDHFPNWEPCWSCWINDDVVVKHRWKGGIHAPHNNAIQGGKSMVTGHLHSQRVSPWSDYNGDRWGVDAGCLADVYGPQFLYVEDNPRNWRAGFVVLTFVGGELLQPELVRVMDKNRVDFRGKIIRV